MSRIRRDGAGGRKARIHEVKRDIEKLLDASGGVLELDYVLAYIDYNHGLRPQKTLEYLETLRTLKVFDFDVEMNFIKYYEKEEA